MRRTFTSVRKGVRPFSHSMFNTKKSMEKKNLYQTTQSAEQKKLFQAKQPMERKNLKDIGRKNLFMTTHCDNPRIYNPRRSAVQQFMALPNKSWLSTDRFIPIQVNNLILRLDAPKFPTFDDEFALSAYVNNGKDPKQITFETITGSDLFMVKANGINGLNMLLWTIFTQGPVDIKMAVEKTDQILAIMEKNWLLVKY